MEYEEKRRQCLLHSDDDMPSSLAYRIDFIEPTVELTYLRLESFGEPTFISSVFLIVDYSTILHWNIHRQHNRSEFVE